MARRQSRHTGDDQLVYGLPKHMHGVSTKESLAEHMAGEKAQRKVEGRHYWTVHPKPKACDECLAMADEIFLEEPQRPHPHCKCEYKKHDIKDPKTAWAFDGKSLCMKGGPCFPCVSGGFGKGALPPGVYTITGNAVPVPKSHKKQPAFCDKNGNCWWVPIKPDFDAGGRGGFGIHPDGNKSGTEGCIGLTDDDTSEARRFFKNAKGQKIHVK